MSIISDRHSLVPFSAGESKAFQDQRLAKITYKPRTQKNGEVKPGKFPSVCVSVPQLNQTEVQENIKRVLPHVLTMLETAQDGVIRSLYESSEGQLKEVSDADISLGGIIAFLEAESTGSKLTAEKIKDWFKAEVADNLFVVIAERQGWNDPTVEQEIILQQALNSYAEYFAGLNGKMVSYEVKIRNRLREALALCRDEDSAIASKLTEKLDSMEAKKIEELL